MVVFIALHDTVPCPHCESSMKSYQWSMLSGSLGDYLLSVAVSGVCRPQSEALRGVLRVCGLIRMRIVDRNQRAIKQASNCD